MDELIEKLSLYDCLVRLITGGLVILITYYSGLVDTFWKVGDSSIIVFGFCAYGVGMILEEISYMLKMRRKNMKNGTRKKEYCLEIIKNIYRMNLWHIK